MRDVEYAFTCVCPFHGFLVNGKERGRNREVRAAGLI